MQIEHVRNLAYPWEGYSGWPISWQLTTQSSDIVVSLNHALKMKELNVSTTEIPFHEISHNFDNYKWVFEAEALAILKIYYHYSVTGQSMAVSSQDSAFTGTEYKLYMKSYANRYLGEINYDEAMAQNVYSPYSLAYNLGNVADKISWQAFTDTFTYFYSLTWQEAPKTKLDKFNLFISKLSDFSGQDVLSMFTSKEISIYEAYLGGKIAKKPAIVLISGVMCTNLEYNNKSIWPPTEFNFMSFGSQMKPYLVCDANGNSVYSELHIM